MRLFAYGTLMEPAVLSAVTGQQFPSRPAVLHEYARYRVRNAVYPGLLPEPVAVTRGVLYDEMDADTLARLDAFEGALYDRLSLSVDVDDTPGARTPVTAEVYVIRPTARRHLSPDRWDFAVFRRLHLATYLGQCPG
jgi:gamma-glutamylcyclotransferase (GGCT)/AIG2-like uncharacterized protein YtfP